MSTYAIPQTTQQAGELKGHEKRSPNSKVKTNSERIPFPSFGKTALKQHKIVL